MNRIVTLCMKPTLDISTSVTTVVAGPKLRCGPPHREPGGGSVNVARAITKLGGSARVIYPAGGSSGDYLRDLLEKEGVEQTPIPVEAMLPESVVVLEESSGRQYRFNFPGARLGADDWRACLSAISGLSPPPAFVVASGSLPPGVPEDFYARLARKVSELGAKFVLDTHGPPLIEATGERAYLIKANLKEFQDVAGGEVEDERDIPELAAGKVLGKKCEVLVVSLGAAGAILISERGATRFCAPVVPVRSRVGAGDSMVGGLVMKLARGASPIEAVRFGLAAGTAAVMTPGTELCRRTDAERLYRQLGEMGLEVAMDRGDDPA